MAYAKDLQEDKEPVFDAAETLMLAIPASAAMVVGLRADRDAMRAAAGRGFPTATDLADWLVRNAGMTFRDAHRAVGAIVKAAEAAGCELSGLPLETMREIAPAIDESVHGVLSVEASVAARVSAGGTAPQRVAEAVAAARRRFLG